ncbi:hypothetical protein [Leifsonia sp. 71-9]|uniref:DUF4177 domain-containing protein n=1 Tax=Leifsonia sp. 71-9 TaxID=1895934 RepID=UPI000925CB7A|nr:hypothetical protein [Leifsonia sp. 71-9]OJX72850.1 MAG: hypothetical protein BGO91_13860 [Leifsonia sp. 71-9]
MAVEYRFVTYHPGNKSDRVDENITAELNKWSRLGWQIKQVIRAQVIGPVSFVLVRGDEQ